MKNLRGSKLQKLCAAPRGEQVAEGGDGENLAPEKFKKKLKLAIDRY